MGAPSTPAEGNAKAEKKIWDIMFDSEFQHEPTKTQYKKSSDACTQTTFEIITTDAKTQIVHEKDDGGGGGHGSSTQGDGHKYTFMQACGLNTMMMFGTGPFISIPLCLAATDPAGPQAMIGYSIAAFGCAADSFIWGELGSRWPMSGGSYVYLREIYGRETWGKLAAFTYLWQFWISAPAEIASAFIAIAEYLTYIHGYDGYWTRSLTAAGLTAMSIFSLYRKVDDIGKVTMFLWAVTIFAMGFTIIAGMSHFDVTNLEMSPNTFDNPSRFIFSLSAACRLGVYDFTGYYDVCQMGGEVQNPRKTIPYSCIITCLVVLVIYMLTYISVIGYLPWDGPDGFVTGIDSGSAGYIMATFTEKMINRGFAIFFVIVCSIVIFGSAFSMICGVQHLPVAAAEDGLFFSFFAHKSEKHPGLPDHSLLCIGAFTLAFCFVDISLVIDAMTTMLILVQFIGQSAGILVYRYYVMQEDDVEAWKMPLFPLPVILQLIVFIFIFVSTENYLISGHQPLMEMAFGFVGLGVIFFLGRQKLHKDWPFAPPKQNVRLSFYKKELAAEAAGHPGEFSSDKKKTYDAESTGHESVGLKSSSFRGHSSPTPSFDPSFPKTTILRSFSNQQISKMPSTNNITSKISQLGKGSAQQSEVESVSTSHASLSREDP